MRRVEEKLADWHLIYKRLENARRKLKKAADGPTQEELQAEVRALEGQGDIALDDIQAALAAAHRSQAAANN